MQEGKVNLIGEKGNEKLTAMVIIEDDLVKKSRDRFILSSLNNREVYLHEETAEEVPAAKSIRIKVSLKEKPTISSYILAKFLYPLSERTKEFLAEKNLI